MCYKESPDIKQVKGQYVPKRASPDIQQVGECATKRESPDIEQVEGE